MKENKIRISCKRENLTDLRDFITEQAEKSGLKPSAVRELNIVAEEVGYNIIKYGQLDERAEFEVETQSVCGRFKIIFRDRGVFFDPTTYRGELKFDEKGDLKEGGLGLTLVKKLVSEWSYKRTPEGVNVLKIERKIREGMPMKINTSLTSTDPRYQLLELSGELDATGAEVLEEELDKTYKDDMYNIVLDFSACPYISSTGLRVLFSTLNKVKRHKGSLVLTGVQEPVRKLFTVADCERLFNFYPTLKDFLTSIK
ncbi:MAG: anti-sigma factor antagonist [Candidatus Eremiobacteraeota bacterium]|nr:anti-sigma factor antagonist [Candidatus Eremiobacteraeota bacterium]